jgi:hypothetical protein
MVTDVPVTPADGTSDALIHPVDWQDEAEVAALLHTTAHDSSSSEQAGQHADATAPSAFSLTFTQHGKGDSTADGTAGSNSSAGAAAGSSTGWTKAVLCLCGTHALARWGWRTWEFAVALILIKLFPASLLLVSVFGLLDNIVRLAFGSVIGQFVDRWVWYGSPAPGQAECHVSLDRS